MTLSDIDRGLLEGKSFSEICASLAPGHDSWLEVGDFIRARVRAFLDDGRPLPDYLERSMEATATDHFGKGATRTAVLALLTSMGYPDRMAELLVNKVKKKSVADQLLGKKSGPRYIALSGATVKQPAQLATKEALLPPTPPSPPPWDGERCSQAARAVHTDMVKFVTRTRGYLEAKDADLAAEQRRVVAALDQLRAESRALTNELSERLGGEIARTDVMHDRLDVLEDQVADLHHVLDAIEDRGSGSAARIDPEEAGVLVVAHGAALAQVAKRGILLALTLGAAAFVLGLSPFARQVDAPAAVSALVELFSAPALVFLGVVVSFDVLFIVRSARMVRSISKRLSDAGMIEVPQARNFDLDSEEESEVDSRPSA